LTLRSWGERKDVRATIDEKRLVTFGV